MPKDYPMPKLKKNSEITAGQIGRVLTVIRTIANNLDDISAECESIKTLHNQYPFLGDYMENGLNYKGFRNLISGAILAIRRMELSLKIKEYEKIYGIKYKPSLTQAERNDIESALDTDSSPL